MSLESFVVHTAPKETPPEVCKDARKEESGGSWGVCLSAGHRSVTVGQRGMWAGENVWI